MNRRVFLALGFGACAGFAAFAVPPDVSVVKAELGRRLFFDTQLSQPAGQSCATCHDPAYAFSDPDQTRPTSEGVLPGLFGPRNAPSLSYANHTDPRLHFSELEGGYIGGFFLDGRAASATDQATFPFLNSVEMHNPNKLAVVRELKSPKLAPLYRVVYGQIDPADIDGAYLNMSDAIAAYEFSAAFATFTSKYDYYLAGTVQLTDAELRGLDLFNDQNRANCIFCHRSTVGSSLAGPDAPPVAPLFTDFGYDNIGIPKNWENPFLYLPPSINPDGVNFIDLGLQITVEQFDPENAYLEAGKFKAPSLRNLALTAPYGHNGYFKTIKDVVHFYNTRDVPSAHWPPPEVPSMVNHVDLGDLGLTEQEEDDMVTFMLTLTDGYVP